MAGALDSAALSPKTGEYESLAAEAAGPRLLVIDELSYLPLPDNGALLLFQVINQRI